MSEENIPGKGETTLTKPRTVDGIFRVSKENQFAISVKSSDLSLQGVTLMKVKLYSYTFFKYRPCTLLNQIHCVKISVNKLAKGQS